MAELPELPEGIRRLHVLRWIQLREKLGFNGEHLSWHGSPGKRREAAKPPFSLAPPPPQEVTSRRSGEPDTFYGRDGKPISYTDWRELQMASWKTRESDPAVIDSIGIKQTIMLADGRLEAVIKDYVSFWASETNGDSGVLAQWADAIGLSVAREVAAVWKRDEWHTAWFDRACREKVGQALEAPIDAWKKRATALEIQHLENSHLSLHSLFVAEGHLKGAFMLDQGKRALESAHRRIDALRSNLAKFSANDSRSGGPEMPSTNVARAGGEPAPTGESLSAAAAPEVGGDKPKSEDGSTERIGQWRRPSKLAIKPDDPNTTRRRGFEADTERHTSIAEIVGRHDARWRNGSKAWRGDSTLQKICADLDRAEIDVPAGWRTGKTRSLGSIKVPSWSDAIKLGYRKLVIDQIRYSLDMAPNTPQATN